MTGSFIPSFHFDAPSSKLTSEWAYKAVTYCWFNSRNINLLHGKKVQEIENYSSGNFSMNEYRKLYKSQKSQIEAIEKNNQYANAYDSTDSSLGYQPLALITPKINSATAIIQKIPIDISATAQDPLAVKKKDEDLTFLKNKPALENDLQEIADQMGIGKVDLGTTKHSAIPFSSSPYGLDLNEPDELEVFVDLLYNLSVETTFETVLQQFWEIKSGLQVKLLEIKDQFKFGVSCHRSFTSSLTSLPDFKYVHPATVVTPNSDLPDFSDNTHRFIPERLSVMDMFNSFGNEICNEETLIEIINAKEFGYCACNGMTNEIPYKDFNSFKVELVYCEIKSVDYVGVAPLNKKSRFSYVVTDAGELEKCENKVWGQNTYCFWWLKNTKYFFGIHRLGYAHRAVGQESYQSFSTNIYKSQEKSAVELSIGENKKAQIADIKMQHAIIKSLPAGKYIDLRFLRNAMEGLIEGNDKYTMDELIRLAYEENQMIGDTQGFEGKNDGQFKPFVDIPGGVKSEVIGYIQVIADASQKISQITGINEQLTGQSANPEGLIGLQKLLINSSINALYYVNAAIEYQYQRLMSSWASLIKDAVEKGGKAKAAIVNLIGAKKVSLIDALDDLPLHSMGITVSIKQREEERQEFRNELSRLKQLQIINTVDEYMLEGVTNPKDRMALLAVKYKQWEKKQARIREEDRAAQQQLMQQQGQNQMAATKEKTASEVEKIYAQGDVSSKILQLASDLSLSDKEKDFLMKRALQQDRGADQLQKSLKTLQTKQELEIQKPMQ